MLTLIFLAFLGLLSLAVWRSRRTAAATLEGVAFTVALPVQQVSAALTSAYVNGAKAKGKALLRGVVMRRTDGTSFSFATKSGDAGRVVLEALDDGGTSVRARTTSLFVGYQRYQKVAGRSGSNAIGADLTHLLCRALNVTPNAGRMKSFQDGLERSVRRELARSQQRS